jgi:diaminopimelate dehydrogenase
LGWSSRVPVSTVTTRGRAKRLLGRLRNQPVLVQAKLPRLSLQEPGLPGLGLPRLGLPGLGLPGLGLPERPAVQLLPKAARRQVLNQHHRLREQPPAIREPALVTRIAIVGYGNLGRGVETVADQHDDIDVVGVFTRRPVADVKTQGTAVLPIADLGAWADEIDVAVLTAGSATDLPELGPAVLRLVNTVDSFDTHARIPQYFATMDAVGAESGHLAMVSAGWDPGLFSMNRVLFDAVLPVGDTITFWGPGVSQGHSNAVRRIKGVADAVQYTIPKPEAVANARTGAALSTRDKHSRVCYVVLAAGADPEQVQSAIVNMPNYFADYDTTVHFVSAAELDRGHRQMPHGGLVVHRAETSAGTHHVLDFQAELTANPEFTAAVLIACARAVHRAASERSGAVTMIDLPLAYYSPRSDADLRATFW